MTGTQIYDHMPRLFIMTGLVAYCALEQNARNGGGLLFSIPPGYFALNSRPDPFPRCK